MAAGKEGSLEVDIEAAVPFPLGHLLGGAFDPDAGGVHQQVEPAETRDRRCHHRRAVGDLGDIGHNGERPGPERPGRRAHPLGIEIGQRQRGAGRSEAPREGQPHAAGRTGDQDDLL